MPSTYVYWSGARHSFFSMPKRAVSSVLLPRTQSLEMTSQCGGCTRRGIERAIDEGNGTNCMRMPIATAWGTKRKKSRVRSPARSGYCRSDSTPTIITERNLETWEIFCYFTVLCIIVCVLAAFPFDFLEQISLRFNSISLQRFSSIKFETISNTKCLECTPLMENENLPLTVKIEIWFFDTKELKFRQQMIWSK